MWPIKVSLFVILAISYATCSENAVICYYGTWATYRHGDGKFNVENIDPNLCTHLLYSFTGINDQGTIISLDPWLDLPDDWGRDNFGLFNALKHRNPSLKTILVVGGWNEGSAKYSIMAANPALRRNFIDSALRLILTHGFDGLDIDWEYPNQRDTVHGRADVDNFTQLLRELRAEFNQHGLLLTVGVAAVEESASLSYDIPAISQYLDLVNLMTYDMAGSWDPITGHNAPLHTSYPSPFSVEKALNYWINSGCPREKLAIGVPFYARTFALANPNDNGLGAPVNGAGPGGPYTGESGNMGYNEICHKLRTEPWTQRYDEQAKVPYAFRGAYWATYDDIDSITKKVEYARSIGINKVMIWSIETDDFHGICGNGVNPLLQAVNRALGGITTSPTNRPPVTPPQTPPPPPPPPPGSSTTAPPPGAICQSEGFTANPHDCSSFYRCTLDDSGSLIATRFDCPAGLYWDQSILNCNFKDLVNCRV